MKRFENTSHLKPGRVDKEHFSLLINISSIRSGSVIYALEDYFVNGGKRKVICERHNVNQGYFSLKVKQIQYIDSIVNKILPFYINRLVSHEFNFTQ